MTDLDLRTSPETGALIELTDVSTASARNLAIPGGTPTAFHIAGAATNEIRINEIDLSRAKQAVDVDPSVKADAVHVQAPAADRIAPQPK